MISESGKIHEGKGIGMENMILGISGRNERLCGVRGK